MVDAAKMMRCGHVALTAPRASSPQIRAQGKEWLQRFQNERTATLEARKKANREQMATEERMNEQLQEARGAAPASPAASAPARRSRPDDMRNELL